MLTSKICQSNDKIKISIRKLFNINQDEIKQNIFILKNWIKQQPHLPQGVQDDDFLERVLLRNKFRIEQCKEKLEKYYTLRGIHYNEFKDLQIDLPSSYTDLIIPLPQLTDNYERIIIIKVNPNVDIENHNVMNFFKYAMCATEILYRTDYCSSVRIIHDFENFTFNHFKKYASKISIYSTMYQEAYFTRISGIEYLNVPPFIDLLMQAGRVLISSKIFKRIIIHKSLESLHKNVSKNCLPIEFGGTLKPLNDYVKLWDDEFKNNLPYFDNILNEISNENLRIGPIKYNECFGTSGTFKSLNLD